jgi:hypothetical protein
MIDDFDRDGLIALLQQLNSDEDERVLAAARALRGGMRATGKTWDDLLRDSKDEPRAKSVVEDDVEDDEADEADEADEVDEDNAINASSSSSMTNDDALKLIERMIKKFKVSAMMREELEGYKEDITDGEFDADDQRYLQSLYDRLAK